MRLLSKPVDYDFNRTKQYEIFGFFNIALTDRNWIGEVYTVKDKGLVYMEQMRQKKETFSTLFKEFDVKSHLTLLLDTSIFSGPLIRDQTLEQFLINLSEHDHKDEKDRKLVEKKIRYYANKVENFVLLYAWSYNNDANAYAKMITLLLDAHVVEMGVRAKNQFIKLSKSTFKESQTEEKTAIMITQLEKMEAELFGKFFKYVVNNPLFMFFAVKMILIFYNQSSSIVPEGNVFVLLEKRKHGIDVFLKDSTPYLNQLFLTHETFIQTLPKTPRDPNGYFGTYKSLHDIKVDDMESEQEKIDVLKTIVSWVAARIPENKNKILPDKSWIHIIKSEWFKKSGLTSLCFSGSDSVAGPYGTELLIRAIAYTAEEGVIMFPVFDPDSWDHLNSRQCAFIAYSICLYHDICIENNYYLKPLLANGDQRELYFPYELITKEGTSFASLNDSETGSKKNKEEKQRDNVTEHWVTFHFRRLKPKQRASEEARANARKYHIERLPDGFTFVDSFIKGERTSDPSKMKISALSVLNNTLSKIEHYS
jgi:hypothetical protein